MYFFSFFAKSSSRSRSTATKMTPKDLLVKFLMLCIKSANAIGVNAIEMVGYGRLESLAK